MKKLLAILISLSLLLQCTAQFTVLALFRLRQDDIARNLCENRSRPELKCCGRCKLNKQLLKVTTGSETPRNGQQKAEKIDEVLYLLPAITTYVRHVPCVARQDNSPGQQHMSGRLLERFVFRPPALYYTSVMGRAEAHTSQV